MTYLDDYDHDAACHAAVAEIPGARFVGTYHTTMFEGAPGRLLGTPTHRFVFKMGGSYLERIEDG